MSDLAARIRAWNKLPPSASMFRSQGWSRTRLVAGGIAALVVISTLVAANVVTTGYGFVPVGFGFEATAGTIFAGITLAARDVVQDALGRLSVLGLIVIGTVVSFAMSAPSIVVASVAAFALGELLDFSVYTPLRERGKFGGRQWTVAVVASAVVGAFTDTVVFLGIAFGWSAIGPALPGQMVGKLWATLAYLVLGGLVGVALRRHLAAVLAREATEVVSRTVPDGAASAVDRSA